MDDSDILTKIDKERLYFGSVQNRIRISWKLIIFNLYLLIYIFKCISECKVWQFVVLSRIQTKLVCSVP